MSAQVTYRDRVSEKIHEEMITSSDSFNTYDLGKYYVILPQTHGWKLEDFISHFNAEKVQQGLTLNGGGLESPRD